MSDHMSRVVTLSPSHSPNPIDLRRVGAHPDYWYPVCMVG